MTWTITATDTRVGRPASTTTTDNERIKQMAIAAYRLAGYRVSVTESRPADGQMTLEPAEAAE